MKKLPSGKDLERFGKIIMDWSVENPRPMPWKDFSDPYSIWIAEIILQQTRVAQGIPYFETFIEKFPDVQKLALASEEEVLSAWEGLGYYSRARNLHQAAKYIIDDLKGQFPEDYKNLLLLKGVGPYTAAAIASFAYDEPVGVVDGNVKRVMSRYWGIDQPVEDPKIHRYIQQAVNRIVEFHASALFNQAIMNFGALQCVPANPRCDVCPLKTSCIARLKNRVSEWPVKKRAVRKKELKMKFGLYLENDRIALVKNTSSNIWKGLFLFPSPQISAAVENPPDQKPGPLLIEEKEWILTHRKLLLYFYRWSHLPHYWQDREDIIMVKPENLKNFALPRPLRLFLEDNSDKLGIKHL